MLKVFRDNLKHLKWILVFVVLVFIFFVWADFGTGIGLGNEWVVQILKGTGNYAEIFDRNVGEATPLKIARGKNALWNQGGLQYAPPIR